MGLDAREIVQGASPTDSAAGDGTDNGQQPEGQQPDTQPQTAATAQTNAQQATRQAYDTPAAQELAAIKRELGLPRNAKLETVQRALNDLRQQEQSQAVDYDNLDPVVAARLEAANEQVWTLTEQVHGDVFTQEARNLFDAALAERNPHDFINRLTQFIEAVTYDPNAEGDDDDGQAQYADDSAQMPSLGDADVPVSPRQVTKNDPSLGGRRDSGDMSGFVGDKLRGLGILGPKEPRGA